MSSLVVAEGIKLPFGLEPTEYFQTNLPTLVALAWLARTTLPVSYRNYRSGVALIGLREDGTVVVVTGGNLKPHSAVHKTCSEYFAVRAAVYHGCLVIVGMVIMGLPWTLDGKDTESGLPVYPTCPCEWCRSEVSKFDAVTYGTLVVAVPPPENGIRFQDLLKYTKQQPQRWGEIVERHAFAAAARRRRNGHGS